VIDEPPSAATFLRDTKLTPAQIAKGLRVLKIQAQSQGLRYVPHPLHPKQLEFQELTELEGLYGGAAGGGKTDAILADALRYVHRPGYAALLLRRSYAALKLPGALLDRSHTWLDHTDAHWVADSYQWRFPSGAVLQFGYCDKRSDLQRYQSAEFSRIYPDELTEWPLEEYEFLFSRLRAPKSVGVPLAMRGATNPGGLGGEWVRQRFGIPEGEIVSSIIRTKGTVFLPARVEDNPSIDLDAYDRSLSKLGPEKYQQLRWGRWIRDGEGLVYYALSSQNVIRELPAEDVRAPWSYLLGIDYGFTNPTAFVVLATRAEDPVTYVVKSFERRKLDADAAAEETRWLMSEFAFERIVGDVGGAGKAYAEEARRRFQIPVEAAEKTGKVGYIDLLNGALSQGKLMIVSSDNEDLLQCMRQLPWARNKKDEHAGFANHLSDALLYGWRASYSYAEQYPDERQLVKPKKLLPETREYWQREQERLEREESSTADSFEHGRYSLDTPSDDGYG
jgi:hypothetical protein